MVSQKDQELFLSAVTHLILRLSVPPSASLPLHSGLVSYSDDEDDLEAQDTISSKPQPQPPPIKLDPELIKPGPVPPTLSSSSSTSSLGIKRPLTSNISSTSKQPLPTQSKNLTSTVPSSFKPIPSSSSSRLQALSLPPPKQILTPLTSTNDDLNSSNHASTSQLRLDPEWGLGEEARGEVDPALEVSTNLLLLEDDVSPTNKLQLNKFNGIEVLFEERGKQFTEMRENLCNCAFDKLRLE